MKFSAIEQCINEKERKKNDGRPFIKGSSYPRKYPRESYAFERLLLLWQISYL